MMETIVILQCREYPLILSVMRVGLGLTIQHIFDIAHKNDMDDWIVRVRIV